MSGTYLLLCESRPSAFVVNLRADVSAPEEPKPAKNDCHLDHRGTQINQLRLTRRRKRIYSETVILVLGLYGTT